MTTNDSMIARTWTATATPIGAESYRRYFSGTLLPQLRDLPGFTGASLLSRDLDHPAGTVELTAHTFWQSLEAIHAFAGPDITASVVEPEAQAVLLAFDPTVTHRLVWVDART
jgi:heme-degrading monooxygenase HmoA